MCRNSSSFCETVSSGKLSKMTPCLKITALILVCSILLTQAHCAVLHPQRSELSRPKRMTPFWRGVTRPVGASCRDDSECFSRLCRRKRCALMVPEE